MSNELVAYQELEKKAMAVAKSGLFGVKTPEQAIALFLVAEAENIPIMQAVLDYHIIDNKPALKSDAMLRRFQASGGVVKWVERSDTKVSAYFSHPSSPEPILIDWDMARAEKAKLSTRVYKSGEPNMWQKFPRQMLTARVISEGIRATAPGAASGIYTPEEVMDFDKPNGKPEVSMPKPVNNGDPIRQDAQEAVIVPEPTHETPQVEKPLFNADFAQKALKAIAKNIGTDALQKILDSHGLKTSEDVKDKETLDKINVEAWKVFKAQKAVKSA